MPEDFEVFSESRLPVKAWTKGVPVEESAKQQLLNLANMPFVVSHVAAMPDVHWGMGATIGSVFATEKAIIPAAVGVDIGCGMCAVKTSLTASDLPDNLHPVRSMIEMAVPHGRTDNGGPNDVGAFRINNWENAIDRNSDDDRLYVNRLTVKLGHIADKHPKIAQAANNAGRHVGTLGGGNHFIEICLDENQNVWVMLHSGSRGIGNRIGTHFIELAKKEMQRWYINLPDKDLAYLPAGSKYFNDYLEAVHWAQEFALLNRKVMMKATLEALKWSVHKPFTFEEEAVNCHHNYVATERHLGKNLFVTRKGALNAANGVMGIIPGSMGAKSFIVRGKGNPLSFNSCSHGAGRLLGRNEAMRRFTVEDHVRDTDGVECRKDSGVIDETPKCYKDIDAVMKAQESLVEVVHTLKQVVCVKG